MFLCASALVAAAALTGCASRRLSSEPSAGAGLAGDWKLDPARSDDLGKAVEQLRAQDRQARRKAHQGQSRGAPGGEGSASGHGRMHRSGPGSGQEASGPGEGAEGPGIGPPRLSAVDELMSSVPQGDYLRISVSAGAFTVSSGNSSDQYTPGLESDISAEQGDAKQISGWKGADYVIDTTPQWGAEIIQRYGLTKDGRLAMTVRLIGGRTHFTFTRIYERTARVAPLAPPTID